MLFVESALLLASYTMQITCGKEQLDGLEVLRAYKCRPPALLS